MKSTIFAEKTLADCLLLPCQGCYAPKFCGENFRKQPQNCEIYKSYPSQAEVLCIHTICVSEWYPGNEAIHLWPYMYTFSHLPNWFR